MNVLWANGSYCAKLCSPSKKADVADSSLAYADSTSILSWAIDGAKYCQQTKVITGRIGYNVLKLSLVYDKIN